MTFGTVFILFVVPVFALLVVPIFQSLAVPPRIERLNALDAEMP